MGKVIITHYVESQNIRSLVNKDHINTERKRRKRFITRRNGYDRRAQLLAYAQELRHSDRTRNEWPIHKKWRFLPFPRIRIFISRLFCKAKWRRRYHRVISEEKCEVEENLKRRKNKGKRRRKYHICMKLWSMLKKLSYALKCKE
ncbi:hypothetical protein LguiA_018123 [Lonicera macranthoides]